MKAFRIYAKNHPVMFGGFMFGILSIIVNLAWFLLTGSPHIYDIVHALPTLFIMGPVVDAMGGLLPTDLLLAPLAIIIDFLVGLLAGLAVSKFTKKTDIYMIVMFIMAALYIILITYQWLPIL